MTMWICLRDGFLSIVVDKNDPTRLLVRARRKEHLVNVFGKDAEMIKTPGADYRWRVFVGRADFKTLVNRRLDGIEYTSFQDSVKDRDLDEMYKQFWNIHHRHQDQDVTNRIDNWRSRFVRRVGGFVPGKPKKFDFGHFPDSFQSLCSTGTGNPGQVMSR
jgi:hypothetical protein